MSGKFCFHDDGLPPLAERIQKIEVKFRQFEDSGCMLDAKRTRDLCAILESWGDLVEVLEDDIRDLELRLSVAEKGFLFQPSDRPVDYDDTVVPFPGNPRKTKPELSGGDGAA